MVNEIKIEANGFKNCTYLTNCNGTATINFTCINSFNELYAVIDQIGAEDKVELTLLAKEIEQSLNAIKSLKDIKKLKKPTYSINYLIILQSIHGFMAQLCN